MIFKYSCCFVLLFFAVTHCFSQNTDPNAGLIPAPYAIKPNPGKFFLHKRSILQTDLKDNRAAAFLSDYLKQFKISNDSLTNDTTASVIVLTHAGTDTLSNEAYHLSITPNRITIAGRDTGLFYGVQSLIQLLYNAKIKGSSTLNCMEIDDHPRFKYRGMMLDVSRHFFPTSFVKEYIDLLAAYKINYFHWHLTDDQGWRIEIKKYPKLTEVGSVRAQTLIGNSHDRPRRYDGTPYGGFYTQEEIRDIVKYAADRFVTIVPEIEMPGHAQAALAAYPELSCNPNKFHKVAESWGDADDVYCPSEYTFNFLEDVLTEVMDLFPGKYIHIGGDEVKKSIWHASPFCRQMIKRLRLKNEHGLQSYFIQRIEKFLNDHGRSTIGWDEILQGGLAPNATVMSWRGEGGGIEAARQKHEVIMTSQNAGLYFDKAQGKSDQEPLSIGGYAPLEKTYAYNPVRDDYLNSEQQKYIIGVQANLWTEYIATQEKAEYMLLPRMLALSEIAWTPLANKNFKDFSEVRLPLHLNRLDAACINYRVPKPIGIQDTFLIAPQISYTLKPSVADARIFYTLAGNTSAETYLPYTAPIHISLDKNQVKTLQAIQVTPDGKKSIANKVVLYNREPFSGLDCLPNGEGLKYQVVRGNFLSAAQLDTALVTDTGTTKNLSVYNFKKNNPFFGVIYQGYLRIDEDGNYNLSLRSDDGSQLYLDDELVVDNDGKHAVFQKSSTLPISKGFHNIKIKYFDAGSFGTFKVYLNKVGKPQTELPPDILFN